jgi:alcohol dehydrogenase (cytochrome c)
MKIDYTAKLAPGESNVGLVRAISVKTGATAWDHAQRAGVMAVVATGGGLVFGGDAAGGFRALDAKKGEVRWQTQLGSAVSGIPISYGVSGKQFVAVTTGTTPESGGLARMTPELKVGNDRLLYVFALN